MKKILPLLCFVSSLCIGKARLKLVHFYDFTRSVNTANAPHNFGYLYKQDAFAAYLTLRYYISK